jgi:DNA-binding HxlR family transcriptional regulator
VINAAFEVLGDRWTLIVLRDIVFGNKRCSAPKKKS